MMEMTLFQISKKLIFLKLIQNLIYGLYIWLAEVFDIDQDILQVYNHKNIKLLGKNIIDITLQASRSIRESKKYELVLKVAMLSPKIYLLSIAFINSHLIISTSQFQLSEMFGLI